MWYTVDAGAPTVRASYRGGVGVAIVCVRMALGWSRLAE